MLSAKWLKKPVGKALVAPFLSSVNKGANKEKITKGSVIEITIDNQPAKLSSAVAEFVHGSDTVRVDLKFGPADGVAAADEGDDGTEDETISHEASSPLTPKHFSLSRALSIGSRSGASPAKAKAEFHIYIGERTVQALLHRKLLKKPLQNALIDPFLKYNKTSSTIEIGLVLVEGEPADVTQPAGLFVAAEGPTRVQLVQPGEAPIDFSQILRDAEQPQEDKAPAGNIWAESPTNSMSGLEGLSTHASDTANAEEPESPVFRTVNSSAVARARAARARSKTTTSYEKI